MNKPPEEIQKIAEIVSENEALKGAAVSTVEVAPDVWEITATGHLCVYCGTSVKPPSPDDQFATVHRAALEHRKATVNLHVCRDCGAIIRSVPEAAS